MRGYLAVLKTQIKAYISSTSPFDEKHTRISVYSARFNIIARELHVQFHHRVAFRLSHFQVASDYLTCLTGSFQLAWLNNWVALP